MEDYKRKELITAKEAADILHVRPTTVSYWKNQRIIPFYKIGNKVLFDKADIYAFVDSCKVQSIDQPC